MDKFGDKPIKKCQVSMWWFYYSEAQNTGFAVSNLTFMWDEFGLNFHKIWPCDEVKLLHTNMVVVYALPHLHEINQ